MKHFLALLVCLLIVKSHAQIIPTNRIVSWVPGITVGVRGGIPSPRTNIIDVTQAPYNASNTGNTDVTSSVQSAINTATNGQVVYFPSGTYNILSGITVDKNNITLRGSGTNSILVGSINVSHDPYNNNPTNVFNVISGGAVGSTSMVLNTNTDIFGGTIQVGDMFSLSSLITGNNLFQYIVASGEDSGATYQRILKQVILVTNTSGNTISFTPPLVWNFTNSGVLIPLNENSVPSLQPRQGLGFENFTLVASNGVLTSSAIFMFKFELCHDSWVTNCEFDWGANYNVYFQYSADCVFAHNGVRHAQSAGSNHAGILAANDAGCLFEDNIMADGLQPGFEFNDGFCGNAVFANFMTNNVSGLDFDCHNTHPVMNLFEENISGGFTMDGYFASQSHQTLLRNRVFGNCAFKRWVTYMNVVGNIIGSSNFNYAFTFPIINGYPFITNSAIFEIGMPNIGNLSFTNSAPPASWNWPGNTIDASSAGGSVNDANGIFTFTNTQVSTTNLTGFFTNVPAPLATIYELMFQDGVNTNYYWNGQTNLAAGTLMYAAGTSTNLLMSQTVTVSNGWTLFIVGQNAYQQFQATNIFTEILDGNSVCTNYTFVTQWDTNGVQTIPSSYLYTNGLPSWYGTNVAIDPSNPYMTMNPARARYLGINQNIPPITPPQYYLQSYWTYYWNPETLTFTNNFGNNGGTVSANDLIAANTFISTCKSINCLTDLLEIHLYIGNNTNASATKFRNFPGSPIYLNLSANMTANMFNDSYGWRNTNDGVARWFDNGINLGTMMTNNVGVFSQYGAVVYVTSRPSAINNSSGGLFGFWFATPGVYNFIGANALGSGNGFGDDCYWGGSYVQVQSPTVSTGIIGVEQQATNQTVLWMGYDPVATNTAAFSTSGNNNLFQLLDSQGSSANNFQGSIGFYALTDGQMGYAKYKQFIVAVHTLMVSLGRDKPSPLPCWCVPVTGQSLSVGSGANYALSTNFPNYNIFTASGGPIVYNGSYFPNTGVVPCRENALSINAAGAESICTAWMTEAAALGLTNVNLFSVASGLGGATYTQLSNSTPAFLSNSNALVNCVNWTNLLFTNGVVGPAVMAVHTEADLGNPSYQANIQQWVSDYNTAFQATTHQKNVVKMFHSQASAWSNSSAPYSELALFYETIKTPHSNILVCAKYNLQYSTNTVGDHIHLDEHGYQQLGEYYGKAFYQEMVNGRWEPFRPDLANVTRTNTTVYVPYLGATGGLVFDTNNTCNYGGTLTPYKWPNYGFGLTNLLGASPAITNVTLWNTNTVALWLNSIPVGPSNMITYAINAGPGVNADGYTGGTTNMPGGNLRDQDPTIGTLSGKNLWDWCVLFQANSP